MNNQITEQQIGGHIEVADGVFMPLSEPHGEDSLAFLHDKRDEALTDFGLNQLEARHNFHVSEPVRLPDETIASIEEVAELVPAAISGLVRVAELSMIDDRLRRKDAGFKAVRAALGIDGTFSTQLDPARKRLQRDEEAEAAVFDGQNGHNFSLAKVDLAIDGETGEAMIVELEPGKQRGMGYSAFGRIANPKPVGSGIVNSLGRDAQEQPLMLVLGEIDRFHFPEMHFLARQIREQGGDVEVIDSLSLGTRIIEGTAGTVVAPPQFLSNNQRDIERRMRSEVPLLSDRDPMLEDKGALALLRNDARDFTVEGILQSCIDPGDLQRIRAHIPRTFLLPLMSKRQFFELRDELTDGTLDAFVKPRREAGTRRILTPDDMSGVDATLEGSGSRTHIIQEAVPRQDIAIQHMDVATGAVSTDLFNTRVTAFVRDGELLDVGVTASQGHLAHGGTESILTGLRA